MSVASVNYSLFSKFPDPFSEVATGQLETLSLLVKLPTSLSHASVSLVAKSSLRALALAYQNAVCNRQNIAKYAPYLLTLNKLGGGRGLKMAATALIAVAIAVTCFLVIGLASIPLVGALVSSAVSIVALVSAYACFGGVLQECLHSIFISGKLKAALTRLEDEMRHSPNKYKEEARSYRKLYEQTQAVVAFLEQDFSTILNPPPALDSSTDPTQKKAVEDLKTEILSAQATLVHLKSFIQAQASHI